MTINLINYALAKKDWNKAYEDLKVLEIGGRNLLLDTPGEEVEGIEFRYWNSDYYIVTDSVIDEIKKGGTYTMSVYYTHTESNNDSRFGLIFQFYTDSGFYSQYYSYDTFIESGETGWSKCTFELPDVSDIDEITGARVYIRSDNNVGSGESGKFVKYKMIKLEKGTVATDYTPAPEDINAHPFVAELAETVYRSKQNEERIINLENALTALGGGS